MSETSAPSGHFGTLPLEIQVDILLKLTASDLAAMESSSTHFRSVIVDGELWRRKADILGLRVVGRMEKEISIMLENREGEKDCMKHMKASLQIWHEQIRKVKLERILAKKTEGKYKIKKILKFMIGATLPLNVLGHGN
eukprot:GFUD01027649.1.p1 GENE.GFUD01027649.1~~GFUD01027649.1.p1  ORF type:complete len:139 (-),score=37.48 GFUD01027649.1:162-578(-)